MMQPAASIPMENTTGGSATPVMPAELPYGGDLMAAQRAQDRPAIKKLMALRDRRNEEQWRKKASASQNAWGNQ